MKPVKLSFRERQALKHWEENRPKMVAGLRTQGQLEKAVRAAWNRYTKQLHHLAVEKGLPFNQANELARREIYAPAEEDQPALGSLPQNPTSVEITD